MSKLYEGNPLHPAAPIASQGDRKILYQVDGVTPFSGAAGTTVLPASGLWVASEILAVRQLRRLLIEARYDGAAGATAGYAEIIPMLCTQVQASASSGGPSVPVAPAITDDVWEIPGVTDGAVTAGALSAGTLQNTNMSRTASWGKVVYRPIVIQLGAMLAASNKIRIEIEVDVTSASWFALQAHEGGDQANQGILNLAIVGAI